MLFRSCAAGEADEDSDPSTPCHMCVAGSITTAGATSCTPCAAGLADLDSNPATECNPCPVGGYYSAPGSAACTLCEANWMDSDSDSSTPCIPCGEGAISGVGSTECSSTDECLAEPCVNGGACFDGDNTFFCACPTGWEGPTCAVDTNECAVQPCEHSGACKIGRAHV